MTSPELPAPPASSPSRAPLRSTAAPAHLALSLSPLLAGALWTLAARHIGSPERGLFEAAWRAGALIPEVVLGEGGGLGPQWWRAWSAPLLHAGVAHLLSNALALALAAQVARVRLGWGGGRVALTAYAGGVLAALARAALGGGWSVGLSGGVFALLGAAAASAARREDLGALLALSLLLGLVGGGASADHASHLAGFCLGALGGGLWRLAPAARRAAAARALTLTAALCAAAGLAAALRALSAPGGPAWAWARVGRVSELNAPALTNGLCAVGPLRLNAAASDLWRPALSAPPRPLRAEGAGAPTPLLTLRAAAVSPARAREGEEAEGAEGAHARSNASVGLVLLRFGEGEAGREGLREGGAPPEALLGVVCVSGGLLEGSGRVEGWLAPAALRVAASDEIF